MEQGGEGRHLPRDDSGACIAGGSWACESGLSPGGVCVWGVSHPFSATQSQRTERQSDLSALLTLELFAPLLLPLLHFFN